MKILGISAFYHDSAAALIDGGRVVGDLPEAKFIHKNGFLIGVHGGITDEDRKYLVSSLAEFFQKR